MPQLGMELLGGFRVTLDGAPLTTFESNKVRALLAYLAAEAQRQHPRESLAALLWPDWPDRAALSNLGDIYAQRDQPGDSARAREAYQQSLGIFSEMEATGYIRVLHQPLQALSLHREDFITEFTVSTEKNVICCGETRGKITGMNQSTVGGCAVL